MYSLSKWSHDITSITSLQHPHLQGMSRCHHVPPSTLLFLLSLPYEGLSHHVARISPSVSSPKSLNPPIPFTQSRSTQGQNSLPEPVHLHNLIKETERSLCFLASCPPQIRDSWMRCSSSRCHLPAKPSFYLQRDALCSVI